MRKILLLVAVAFTFLSACSTHEKVLKSKDMNYKLTEANKYYETGKWYKANEVYASLLPSFRGTKNYEELYYRYCYTFYNMKEYLSASYQFKNFVETFPKSTRADECEFMYATCLYQLSPKASLDQTSTYKAMEALQAYINTHPGSPNLTVANNYIQVCRSKIEIKDANAAELYYKIGQYKAASVAFKSLMQNYPDSEKLDYYQYMIMRSFYQYAENSVVDKKEERYAEALSAFQEMQEYAPNSNYIKEADRLSKSAEQKIKQIRNEHS